MAKQKLGKFENHTTRTLDHFYANKCRGKFTTRRVGMPELKWGRRKFYGNKSRKRFTPTIVSMVDNGSLDGQQWQLGWRAIVVNMKGNAS